MNQIIKSFLGVFLILFMVLCCMGVMGMFLNVMQAQNLQASIVKEMEDSNYFPPVVANCMKRANECGYELNVTLYREGADSRTLTKESDCNYDLNYYDMAKVELKFKIQMAMFEIGQPHVLVAYSY